MQEQTIPCIRFPFGIKRLQSAEDYYQMTYKKAEKQGSSAVKDYLWCGWSYFLPFASAIIFPSTSTESKTKSGLI